MTTRNIDQICAEISAPEGRDVEQDLALLAYAFVKKAHAGEFEPWIVEVGDLLANDIRTMIGLHSNLEGSDSEEYWAERGVLDTYAEDLWDVLPEYLEWALDTVAQQRTTERLEKTLAGGGV